MSERAANDLYSLGYQVALEAAIEETETYNLDNPDAWERGFADGCASVRAALKRLLADALATATGTAKTAKQAECEASQSGPKGNAQPPVPHD